MREAEQLRFRTIMVDEFQDTNALQCELIELLAGGPPKDVLFVGDEFQSIYGFRHADVQVFRERRAAAPQVLPLTENYRSRPEVLAAVNYLFEPEFGDGYQPLTASGEFPDPVFGHPVELLVTDKESYAGSGSPWRRAEARHVARRVRELVDAGAAILFYSTDYDELVGCCDRVLVMYDGAIKRELVGAEITERALISSALNIGLDARQTDARQAI